MENVAAILRVWPRSGRQFGSGNWYGYGRSGSWTNIPRSTSGMGSGRMRRGRGAGVGTARGVGDGLLVGSASPPATGWGAGSSSCVQPRSAAAARPAAPRRPPRSTRRRLSSGDRSMRSGSAISLPFVIAIRPERVHADAPMTGVRDSGAPGCTPRCWVVRPRRRTRSGRPEGRPPSPQSEECVPSAAGYLLSQALAIWSPQS